MTAVAGRDYALIASDTRLTDGGYGLRSRNHLGSRIWPVQSSSMNVDLEDVFDDDYDDDGGSVGRRRRHEGSDDCDPPPPPIFVGSAGCSSDCESLRRRMRLEIDALTHHGPSSSFRGRRREGALGVRSVANLLQQVLYGRRSFPYYSFCVVAGLDGATGRGGDRSRGGGGGGGGRRGGWGRSSSSGRGGGAAYVYDAIGSYERVAVACAGTGRELLQPILDRAFSSSDRRYDDIRTVRSMRRRRPPPSPSHDSPSRDDDDDDASNDVGDDVDGGGEHDDGGGRGVEGRAATATATATSRAKTAAVAAIVAATTTADVPASRQRTGIAGPLLSPVRTIVDCTWEESVDRVARAYAAVSEREISVGDEVVICVILARRDGMDDGNEYDGGDTVVRVFRYPLKRH